MKVEFTHRFKKEYDQHADKSNLTELLSTYVDIASSARNLSGLPHLKRLHGFKDHYSIKLGSARIGLKIKDKTLLFAAFYKKKDISKKYL